MKVPKNRWGAHIRHCCILHGCAYGNKDCPVKNGLVKQENLCENCDDDIYVNNVDYNWFSHNEDYELEKWQEIDNSIKKSQNQLRLKKLNRI